MRSRAVQVQEVGESAALGTAAVVGMMVLSLAVVAYFAWYAPVVRQQTNLQVNVPSVSRPSTPALQEDREHIKPERPQIQKTIEVSAL